MGNIDNRRSFQKEYAEQIALKRSDSGYYKLADILPLDSATGIIITTREALSDLFIQGIVQTSSDQTKVFVSHPDQPYFDYGRTIERKLTDILHIDLMHRESFVQKLKSLEKTILVNYPIEQPNTYRRGLNLVSIASQPDFFAKLLQKLEEQNEGLKDDIETAIMQIRQVVSLAHMLSHDLVHLLEAQARGQDPYYIIESRSLLGALDHSETKHSVAIRFMYPQHMLEELITIRLQ